MICISQITCHFLSWASGGVAGGAINILSYILNGGVSYSKEDDDEEEEEGRGFEGLEKGGLGEGEATATAAVAP